MQPSPANGILFFDREESSELRQLYSAAFLCCFGEETCRDAFQRGNFARSRRAYAVRHQFTAALSHAFVCHGILAARRKQFFEPVLAISGMDRLIGPIKIHIVFAERITIAVEELCPCQFVTNVFCLEKIEHSEAINGI